MLSGTLCSFFYLKSSLRASPSGTKRRSGRMYCVRLISRRGLHCVSKQSFLEFTLYYLLSRHNRFSAPLPYYAPIQHTGSGGRKSHLGGRGGASVNVSPQTLSNNMAGRKSLPYCHSIRGNAPAPYPRGAVKKTARPPGHSLASAFMWKKYP